MQTWENDRCPGCGGTLYRLPDTEYHRGYCLEHGEFMWLEGIWMQIAIHENQVAPFLYNHNMKCSCYDCLHRTQQKVH